MRINSGTACVREGEGGAPGPDLGNQLVNRHGRVNVNPGCMFTGGGWGRLWDLSRSLKFLIKNGPLRNYASRHYVYPIFVSEELIYEKSRP